jgi:hypothetical protein
MNGCLVPNFASVLDKCPCQVGPLVTTAWRVLGLRMEGTASSRRLAGNILNKQPRSRDKGWSSSLGVGCWANNPSP